MGTDPWTKLGLAGVIGMIPQQLILLPLIAWKCGSWLDLNPVTPGRCVTQSRLVLPTLNFLGTGMGGPLT